MYFCLESAFVKNKRISKMCKTIFYGVGDMENEEIEIESSAPEHVSTETARSIGNLLGVNWSVVPVEQLRRGMEVELEHGTVNERTDVTDDDMVKTAKIALAHFVEGAQYYVLLEELEKKLFVMNGGKKTDPFLNP